MECSDYRIDIIDCQLPDVGHSLDLTRHNLNIVVAHAQVKLLHATLDSIPPIDVSTLSAVKYTVGF